MIETFRCPSCDATLDLPESGVTAVTCPYCASTVVVPESLRKGEDSQEDAHRKAQVVANVTQLVRQGRKIEAAKLFREEFDLGLKEAKEAVDRLEAGLAPFAGATPTRQKSSGCGRIVTLSLVILLVGLGGFFYFIFGEEDLQETINSVAEQLPSTTRILSGSAALLPGEDGAPTGIVYLEADTQAAEISVAFFDPANGEVIWRGASLGDAVPSTQFVQGSGRVYAISETAVRAYATGDGSLLWEGALSDRLNARCDGCAVEMAGRFLALTIDGDLQALDAATGAAAWRKRGDAPSPSRLMPIGSSIALMASDEEAGSGLEILDPASGNLLRRLEPRCEHPVFDPQEPNVTDPVIFDASAGTITFVFGFFDPGCVSQWEADSGEMLWTAFSDITALSFNTAVLSTPGTIYLGKDSRNLYAVSAVDGTSRLLPGDEDYELKPLEASAGTLFLQAIRSRGTRRDELWAMDSASGQILWRHVPQAPEMLEQGANEAIHATSEGHWAARVSPKGVILMQARHQPPRLIFETLDPLSGASSGQNEMALPGEGTTAYWLQLLGWERDTIWLLVDLANLWQVNPESAEIITRGS